MRSQISVARLFSFKLDKWVDNILFNAPLETLTGSFGPLWQSNEIYEIIDSILCKYLCKQDKFKISSMYHVIFLQFAIKKLFCSFYLSVQFKYFFLSSVFLLFILRRCPTLPTSPASATGCRAPAAWRPAGCSWLTSARWAMHWRKSTTAPQPWSSTRVESWCRCTASSTLPRATTWCTSSPVQTTAWKTKAQAPWAQWGAFATRPQRAWMGVSWCAAAVVTTSTRPR